MRFELRPQADLNLYAIAKLPLDTCGLRVRQTTSH